MSNVANFADSPSRSIARGQLAEYDRILADHAEAVDCGRCEAYMELGIQVLQWILRADQDYRRELYRDPGVHNEAAERELETLVRGWLVHGKSLLAWAEGFATRGFQVHHLEEFRHSFEEATAIVASFDETDADRVLPEPVIVLRDQALVEHRNGETSEFV
jgi:hypothetical protein